MKNVNNRELEENFYRIVANKLEIEKDEMSIIVYEHKEPLHSIKYKYSNPEDCQEDFDELLKYCI